MPGILAQSLWLFPQVVPGAAHPTCWYHPGLLLTPTLQQLQKPDKQQQ